MNKKVPIYLQKHGTCVLALLFSGKELVINRRMHAVWVVAS